MNDGSLVPEDAAVGAAAIDYGRQLLYYAARGPLGGSFTCSRCGQQAGQPDLIEHLSGCVYLQPPRP